MFHAGSNHVDEVMDKFLVWNHLSARLLKDVEGKNEDTVIGFLHSYTLAEPSTVVSYSWLEDGRPQTIAEGYVNISGLLPLGMEVDGIFIKTESCNALSIIRQVCQTVFKMCVLRDSFLVWAIQDSDNSCMYRFSPATGDLCQTEYLPTDANVLDNCIQMRLRATIPLEFEYTQNPEKLKNNILAEVQHIEDTISSNVTAYRVQGSNVLLLNEPCQQEDYSIHQLLAMKNTDGAGEPERKKRLKNSNYSKEVLHVQLLTQMSVDYATPQNILCSPIIHHEHGEFQYVNLDLPVDVVGYLDPNGSSSTLCEHLGVAVNKQLNAMYNCMMSHLKSGSWPIPQPFHFLPSSMGHLITVIYPGSTSDDSLLSTRLILHQQLSLPLNIPQLRRKNVHQFPDESIPGGYLLNPHIGLKSSVKDEKQYLVKGQYTYHHYMQDKMDDNKWGCAYRSLQTLCSWFSLQGYTDKPVPTHKQIQQILVDIGDKEPKFVGSRTWIGSTEVGFVLDTYLGVSSKILYVSSGAELSTKGRELASHFQTQGTPVMIGGGVLAHTILGVDYNDQTGDLKFLILDPHYTGGEELKIIQDKGWCGWKGVDFWDQTAYYNMCMPQAPAVI